jgi:hypothetical protein
MSKALIGLLVLCALGVARAAVGGALGPVTPVAPVALETGAAAAIPVEAQDAEEVAFDESIDIAHPMVEARDAMADAELESDPDMNINLEHNTDLSMPEPELSKADLQIEEIAEENDLNEDEEEEADEEAAFLSEAETVSNGNENEDEEDEESEGEEEEEEEEEGEEDESEEEEGEESEVNGAGFLQVHDQDHADTDSETDSKTDSTATAQTGTTAKITAEAEDTGASISEAVIPPPAKEPEMQTVTDFGIERVDRASEHETVNTAGAVEAGIAETTIEETDVPAETSPVAAGEVISVVADSAAREGGELTEDSEDAESSFVEEDSEADSEDEADEELSVEDNEEEEHKLQLVRSILAEIREAAGKPYDEEITPDEMDEIEEKMSVMVEINADANANTNTNTNTDANAKATANTNSNANANTNTNVNANTNDKAKVETKANVETAAKAATETAAKTTTNTDATTATKTAAATTTTTTATATTETASAAGGPVVKAKEAPRVDPPAGGRKLVPAVIRGREQEEKPKVPQYRWDVDYVADRRTFRHDIELTDKPVHRRDPTAKSTLKNPMKPKVWDRRPPAPPKQKYRYDVQYEARRDCCRARQSCCIRSVQEKKKKQLVRARVGKVGKNKPKRKVVKAKPKKEYRYDVEYEARRQSCCQNKQSCCRPPKQYRRDVEYDNDGNDGTQWVVVARAEAGGRNGFNAQEFDYLKRIHERQRILHKLLKTHPAQYYDEHYAAQNAEWWAAQNEPAAARSGTIVYSSGPQRRRGSGQLNAAEFQELQDWLRQLPRVPKLSVLEMASKTVGEGDAFLETSTNVVRRPMLPVRVLRGFVDIEHQPYTLYSKLENLPAAPAILSEEEDAEDQ